MSWYRNRVLPRIVDVTMRAPDFGPVRARVAGRLDGEVLEIGFGSGHNVPHYPPGLTRVLAVDPAALGQTLAADRLRQSPVPVEFAGLDAGRLPAEDGSVDHVLSTWTLCTVPDAGQVLAEIVRVLRPGGTLCFAEHGLSPDAKVAGRQRRFNPVQRVVFGGCNLDRPIDQLIRSSGLAVSKLDTYYLPGPKVVCYTYEGVAAKAAD
jgi:SAM-dependent methyltransferase